MKAAVWHARRDVRVEATPEPPSPPAGQVKVRTAWCGLCGTDLHEYLGGPLYVPTEAPHPLTGAQAPVILGHEMSGDVVDVGPGVTRVAVGDRVALCPIIGCLECEWCKSGLMGLCPSIAFLGISWHSGAFSRYINVYDYMCYKLPAEVSYELGVHSLISTEVCSDPLVPGRQDQRARLLGRCDRLVAKAKPHHRRRVAPRYGLESGTL